MVCPPNICAVEPTLKSLKLVPRKKLLEQGDLPEENLEKKREYQRKYMRERRYIIVTLIFVYTVYIIQ